MLKGSTDKWRKLFILFKGWDSKKARKVQELESRIIIDWLTSLDLSRYDILEVGCGNGYLGYLISKNFVEKNIDFTYRATDLLPECLKLAKKSFEELANHPSVSFEILDSYQIDKTDAPILISTGYASALTYPDVISRLGNLKKGTIVICDFINFHSPLTFLRHLFKGRLVDKTKEMLNDFKKYGFEIVKKKSIRFRRNPLLVMFRKTLC